MRFFFPQRGFNRMGIGHLSGRLDAPKVAKACDKVWKDCNGIRMRRRANLARQRRANALLAGGARGMQNLRQEMRDK